MSTLDVLLLEAGPGDGAADAARLEAAGHRIHRCFDGTVTAGPTHPSGWAPCRTLTEGGCPLDDGVDVALLARRGVAPRPGPGEAGVRCAVRAGVPVVEDGGDLLDPFAPWITRRTDGDGVVAACEAAAADALEPVLARLRILTRPFLDAAGIDPAEVGATFLVDDGRLVVRLSGCGDDRQVRHAVATRVVDALRATPRRFATVDVGFA